MALRRADRKRGRSSITSSPLFITTRSRWCSSRPSPGRMLQRILTRASRISAAGVFQNGPPDGENYARDALDRFAAQALEDRAVLLSTGANARAGSRVRKSSSPAATISSLLATNVDARINRGNTASNATAPSVAARRYRGSNRPQRAKSAAASAPMR